MIIWWVEMELELWSNPYEVDPHNLNIAQFRPYAKQFYVEFYPKSCILPKSSNAQTKLICLSLPPQPHFSTGDLPPELRYNRIILYSFPNSKE